MKKRKGNRGLREKEMHSFIMNLIDYQNCFIGGVITSACNLSLFLFLT